MKSCSETVGAEHIPSQLWKPVTMCAVYVGLKGDRLLCYAVKMLVRSVRGTGRRSEAENRATCVPPRAAQFRMSSFYPSKEAGANVTALRKVASPLFLFFESTNSVFGLMAY